jgi:hypothetical protein
MSRKNAQESLHHSRTTVPLISAQRDPELDLIEFLRPYKRLSADKVCTQPIEASQVSIWTSKSGVWTHGVPDRAVRNGSWCQSYLTSALNLSRAEYDLAKRELFAGKDSLNGVYKHKSQDLYAIVYKPKNWLNKTSIAAIAGGTALVGLGVAGTRYALRKPQATSQATSKPTPGPKPSVPTSDDLEVIKLHDKQLGEILDKNTDQRLLAEDFEALEEYKALLDAYDQNGGNTTSFRKRVQMFESLVAIGVSQTTLRDFFGDRDPDAIIDDSLFVEDGAHMSRYFQARGDLERLSVYQAALIYKQIKEQIEEDSGDKQSFTNALERLLELADQCEQIYPVEYLIYTLQEHNAPTNKTFKNAVIDILKKHQSTDNELRDQKKLQDAFVILSRAVVDKNEIPRVTAQSMTEVGASLRDVMSRLRLYKALTDLVYGRDRVPDTDTFIRGKNTMSLYERVSALKNLQKSENDTLKLIQTLNESYDIKTGLDETENAKYIRKFVDTFVDYPALIPEDARALLNNLLISHDYQTVVRDLRSSRDPDVNHYLIHNDLRVINQLKRDLESGEITQQEGKLDQVLEGYASRILQNFVTWDGSTYRAQGT